VDDELDTLGGGDADLEHAAGGVGTYQHVHVVEVEHSDRVSVGVEHVVVCDPVLASARQDHRTRDHQRTLIRPAGGGPLHVASTATNSAGGVYISMPERPISGRATSMVGRWGRSFQIASSTAS
jgi:hypothetical protein